ncbi:unnamed protein product, partial [Choristocarpus tenellus]
MIFVDDYNKMEWIRFQKKKNGAAEALLDFTSKVAAPSGMQIGGIQSDEGGEFMSAAFQTVLRKQGVHWEHVGAFTPQYDGVTERALGLIAQKVVAMMVCARLQGPLNLWAEAQNYASDLRN